MNLPFGLISFLIMVAPDCRGDMKKMPWTKLANGSWTQVASTSTAKCSKKAAPAVPPAPRSVNALLREMLRNVSENDPQCGLLKRALLAA